MKLHVYQELAIQFLRNNPRAGLFLDLGLGKTAITLSALTPDHLPALVVAPKRVAERVWPVEHAKWRPDLKLRVAQGTPLQRKAALESRADVTVIGRDNIKDVKRPYRTLVLDELSGFRDRGTTRWKLANLISKRAAHVWGLTGTPAPNGLLDLWAQLYLLDRGERLGTSLTSYRSRYFLPDGQLPSGIVTGWRLRPEADAHIHNKISDLCLYMSSDTELDLPPVTYNTITLEMPKDARAQYDTMRKDMVLDLEMLGGEIHSASTAAVLTQKLSQMTAGFLYSDAQDGTYRSVHAAKIEALREVVDGTGSPVLVFYRYKAEAARIRAAFPEARMLDERGVLKAWDDGAVPLLLAHPASAGHGLNLQHGGHTVVWTTLPWDLEHWLQANGRLARQGQRHPVVVHTLECERSIDQVVAARLRQKTWTQDALLDHLQSPL